MTPSGAPRALLWDVGNVIVRWDPRTLYAKIFKEPADLDRFLSHVGTLDWHAATDRGVTFADNIAALSAEHPHHAEHIAAWWDRWPEMFSGTIPETESVIEDLAARGVPQFGLTNMSGETWPGVRAMSPAFRHFRDTVVSGDERVIKPDPRIFEIVLARTGLAPGELLFVDDSAANIAAAAAMGFHTHHFTDPAALRPAIERFGLL
ncbi:haloacid dehalogenase superfamily protein, subfamily IA, variant 3 with third motif having DD or ED [Caulobacter sp. AP07]|uniref:HAD family hydrolase n=1 Tax=Caulobacter sp. AP07 TaxID=1144304 RepID=UPI0002720668|nr:HAD family phosphatase [Caulobacter sp. AP07]EJL37154.1 haloacid dehalogenase superfamily protein, subfamily IA, variant 3 with third motif having DD or ED [Caulobacter sp. AP07]